MGAGSALTAVTLNSQIGTHIGDWYDRSSPADGTCMGGVCMGTGPNAATLCERANMRLCTFSWRTLRT